jgi:alkylhydroperoxidase/carboxymuconolactone decarboxylase family protein YurZ
MRKRPPFNEEFQEFITRYAWGEIWTRPHCDERTRRVLVLGTMIALARWDEFRLHVRAALTGGGFSEADIKEIILQQAIYCGVPAANHVFKEAAEMMAEMAKAKEPALAGELRQDSKSDAIATRALSGTARTRAPRAAWQRVPSLRRAWRCWPDGFGCARPSIARSR